MSRIAAVMVLGVSVLVIAVVAWELSSGSATATSASNEAADNRSVVAAQSSTSASDGASAYMAQMAAAQARADKNNPLSSYQPTAGIAGRNALDEIYFKGIPVTRQSVLALGKLLSDGRLSTDEKIVIPRLLAALHNSDNSTGANAEIEADLKSLLSDPDKQVAGKAAIHYARMGYLPDTESVLKIAFDKGALDTDSYYQEMAHLLTDAPLAKKPELMAKIRDSSNRMASEVLAMALVSGQEYNGAPFLKTSPDMAALLKSTQPQMSGGASQLGLVDAVRYAHWLDASAIVESHRTGRSMDDLIVEALSAPGIDPRKIIGYLVQPQAASLLSAATPDSVVYELVRTAQGYAAQFPASQMKDLVGAIEQRMPNPPVGPPPFNFTPPIGPIAPPTQMPAQSLR